MYVWAIIVAALLAMYSMAVMKHTATRPWVPKESSVLVKDAFVYGLISDAMIGVFACISLVLGHPYGLQGFTLALLAACRNCFLIWRILPPHKYTSESYRIDGLVRFGLMAAVTGGFLKLYEPTTPNLIAYGLLVLGSLMVATVVVSTLYGQHRLRKTKNSKVDRKLDQQEGS